jgi:hypothetical protein
MAVYSCKNRLYTADLIFVLAGRERRKQHGLELFRQRLAPRILLSVARFEIRNFYKLPLPVPLNLTKLAFDVPPPQRHFFVFFENQKVQVEHIRPRRFGTLTEITSLARWLETRPEIKSLLIVSSNAHLRRVRMCCQSSLGASINIAFIAAPEMFSGKRPFKSTKADFIEMFKVIVYWVMLKFR